MATKIMTAGMTASDRVAAAILVAGFAIALVQCAQALALPAHFV